MIAEFNSLYSKSLDRRLTSRFKHLLLRITYIYFDSQIFHHYHLLCLDDFLVVYNLDSLLKFVCVLYIIFLKHKIAYSILTLENVVRIVCNLIPVTYKICFSIDIFPILSNLTMLVKRLLNDIWHLSNEPHRAFKQNLHFLSDMQKELWYVLISKFYFS